MSFDAPLQYRRSIRLRGYDYSRGGAYFVTICVQNRECLFGRVVDGRVELNQTGRIVGLIWHYLPYRFPKIELGTYVVMPNHFHGIIVLNDFIVGAGFSRPHLSGAMTVGAMTAPLRKPTLGQIVAYFKYQTTKHINRDKKPPYPKIWQRNYYEHIIQDQGDLDRINEYIQTNPLNWDTDEENPLNWR